MPFGLPSAMMRPPGLANPFGYGLDDVFGGMSPGLGLGFGFGQGINPLQMLVTALALELVMMRLLQGLAGRSNGGSMSQPPWSGGPSPTDWGSASASRTSRSSRSRRGGCPQLDDDRSFQGPGSPRDDGLGRSRSSQPESRDGSPSWPLGNGNNMDRGAGPLQARAPWISQFDGRVPGAGSSACYRAVATMARQVGVNIPPGTGNRIQVATGQDPYGRVHTTPERTQAARNYIDGQLAEGRPVCVGVAHRRGGPNQDGMTGHFVLVNGKGVDEQGRTYYTFLDPATRDPSKGNNPSRNRFYVDPGSGNLVKDGELARGYVVDRHYEMSMVVPSN